MRTNGCDFPANFLASFRSTTSDHHILLQFATLQRPLRPPLVRDSMATDAGSLDGTNASADTRVSNLWELGASDLSVCERLWGFCL
ncbi:hypothetical protein TIFTF001_016561 [Ficus carica]|uniref:Uncharacterized protein n=1 Tax=Ficus carica TaxID=3494 RepID=A0AA88D9Z4_FICCA|nr:hypothetical protein TIFTF001_016561 [Ficus carica]